MEPYFSDDKVTVHLGDCVAVMAGMEPNSVSAIVTDPPYELRFMSSKWDGTGVAFKVETWQAALRVLRPGGYMVAFGGTRTSHRMVCAIEDAGFIIQDSLVWLYAVGFPKGHSQLKPAHEPIVLARKPGAPGVLQIDACRIAHTPGTDHKWGGRNRSDNRGTYGRGWRDEGGDTPTSTRNPAGRWPANVVLGCECPTDEHDPDCAVVLLDVQSGESRSSGGRTANISKGARIYGGGKGLGQDLSPDEVRGDPGFGDFGGASRFFFVAKASKADRQGTTHPTTKPTTLLRWLCRLITPPGGTVLDCFAGSGSTRVAALAEGLKVVLIEKEPAYLEQLCGRVAQQGFDLEVAG